MSILDKVFKNKNTSCCDNVNEKMITKDKAVKENERECSCETVSLTIKILGSGCKNCITLTENVKAALDEMSLEADLIKVTDFKDISAYGVMSTPALVVNEKVISYGKVLKPKEVIRLLERVQG